MEEKYLKDFTIIMVVILLLAFGIRTSYLTKDVAEVPEESQYKRMALSEELMQKIQRIDTSIQDRKNFVFTVEKDPLEQNLIVKTQQDLEKQWEEEVQKMVRLSMTIIPDEGERQAAINHQGITKLYKIGDKFELGKITDIRPGEITYMVNGQKKDMQLQPIPPKPAKLKANRKAKKVREYNW